jgi:hypothetical protein
MTYVRVGSGFLLRIHVSADRSFYGSATLRTVFCKKNLRKKDFLVFWNGSLEEKSKILMQTHNSVVDPRFGKCCTDLENCSQYRFERYIAFIYDMSANFCSAQYAVSRS